MSSYRVGNGSKRLNQGGRPSEAARSGGRGPRHTQGDIYDGLPKQPVRRRAGGGIIASGGMTVEVSEGSEQPVGTGGGWTTIRRYTSPGGMTVEVMCERSDSDERPVRPQEPYEVDCIIGKKLDADHNWLYLVKWKDYTSEHDSWEPINLLGLGEKVRAFESMLHEHYNTLFPQ